MKKYQLLILGSGPAGCTAAIYAARANLEFAMIAGLEQGGQITKTDKIANWPGAQEEISGAFLMENMMNQARSFDTNIISDVISEANLSQHPFHLKGESDEYTCDTLIIATGSSAKFLGIPSEEKYVGKGISSCAVCDGFFYRNKKVVVIGGGGAMAEEALYLSKIAKTVTVIHRRDSMRAEPLVIEHMKNTPNIEFELGYTVTEFLGDEQGVTGLTIKNVASNETKNIEADGIFMAIGHKPNTEPFEGQIEMEHGYIKTGHKFSSATSVPGVFAAGDVVSGVHRQAVIAAGSGCTAALDAKNFLLCDRAKATNAKSVKS